MRAAIFNGPRDITVADRRDAAIASGATRIGAVVSEQIVAATPPRTAITWGGAAYRRTS